MACSPGRAQGRSSDRGQQRAGSSGDGSGLFGDIPVDSVQVVGDPGVDAWPVGLSPAIAPADHAHLQPGAPHLADRGSSRVTLRWGGRVSGGL